MFLIIDLWFCKIHQNSFENVLSILQNEQNKPILNEGQRHFIFMVDIQFTLITCGV